MTSDTLPGMVAVGDVSIAAAGPQFSWDGGLSMVLNQNGIPHLTYVDGYGTLKHVYSENTSWSTGTIDTYSDLGQRSAITLDASERTHIAYYDFTRNTVKHATSDGSSWNTETVDTVGSIRGSLPAPDVAIDAGGGDTLAMLYFAQDSYPSDESLRYAEWDGTGWMTETLVYDIGGHYADLVVDNSGTPHVSYYDGQLVYAYRTGTSWITLSSRPTDSTMQSHSIVPATRTSATSLTKNCDTRTGTEQIG